MLLLRLRALVIAARLCCKDIAIVTGGQVVSEEVGLKLENVTLDMLGQARQVRVTKEDTTIVDGKGSSEAIQGRINQIRAEIEETTSDYDREKLQERLAKLAGGVAVIQVGAATETGAQGEEARALKTPCPQPEQLWKKVSWPEAALCSSTPFPLWTTSRPKAKIKTGVDIVRRALEEPLKMIATNAGLEGSIVVEKVKSLIRALASTHTGRIRRYDRTGHHRPSQEPGVPLERRFHRSREDSPPSLGHRQARTRASNTRWQHGRHDVSRLKGYDR